MLRGRLTFENTDKGLHEGLETCQNLRENFGGHLTFVQSLAFANGVSRFHGMLLLCRGCFPHSQKRLISQNLDWVNLERQSN